MAERVRLTDAVAQATRPRARDYAIHDVTLQGFMLRVQPGGARSWVLRFRRNGKSRRVTLGRPGMLTVDRARAAALAFLAREKGGTKPVPVPPSGPTLVRLAAEYIERCLPAWRESTRAAVTSCFNSAILPAIDHLRVDAVTRADIARWFHHYGQRWPGGVNRCHEILGSMFARAIDWGHRPESAGNPCTGITRFRRPPRGRLLGAGDLARLGATLRDLEQRWPVRVDAVRLIPLTGCRPGEIRRLRWCEVKPDRLALTNAKTGPRDVLLGEAARELLVELAASASGEWVFPDDRAADRPLRVNALPRKFDRHPAYGQALPLGGEPARASTAEPVGRTAQRWCGSRRVTDGLRRDAIRQPPAFGIDESLAKRDKVRRSLPRCWFVISFAAR